MTNLENRAAEPVQFAANMLFIQISTKIGSHIVAAGSLYRETQRCKGDTAHTCVDKGPV